MEIRSYVIFIFMPLYFHFDFERGHCLIHKPVVELHRQHIYQCLLQSICITSILLDGEFSKNKFLVLFENRSSFLIVFQAIRNFTDYNSLSSQCRFHFYDKKRVFQNNSIPYLNI